MSRQPSSKIELRNKPILKRIRELKQNHPFWGYRRVWAYLKYVDLMPINQKRVYRLMKTHHLLVAKNARLRAKRTPSRSKPVASRPNELWGIDMTKVKTDFGWAYLVIVLDWYSKKIVGASVSDQSKTSDWLQALDRALHHQFPNGVKGKKLNLVSDNGCQPTSKGFMKACHSLEVKQIFTSYNNPKGNADTERVIRTAKEELFWLKEWQSIKQVEDELNRWINEYNTNYLHSSLGYKPPVSMETNYKEKDVA